MLYRVLRNFPDAREAVEEAFLAIGKRDKEPG